MNRINLHSLSLWQTSHYRGLVFLFVISHNFLNCSTFNVYLHCRRSFARLLFSLSTQTEVSKSPEAWKCPDTNAVLRAAYSLFPANAPERENDIGIDILVWIFQLDLLQSLRNGWITHCNELVLVWDQFETAFLEEVTCISRRLIWSITKSSLFRSLNVRTSLVQQKKFFKESVVIGLNYWFVHAFKLKIKPIARGTALISQSSERYFCTLISPN